MTGPVSQEAGRDVGLDAVIFDFAGVLSTSPGPAMIRRAQAHGIDLATVLPIMLGPLDADADHPYHDLERGRITMDEYDRAIESLWRAAGLNSFPPFPRGHEILTELAPVEEMITTARDARAAGYRTAILTNNMQEWSGWRTAWDADHLVDVVIDSCQVGMRKPSHAIFELTLERLGGPAVERTLFVDDFPWNVAAAEALGMQTIHVTDPVAAAAEIRRRLGLAPSATMV